jgi:hypothetical protein
MFLCPFKLWTILAIGFTEQWVLRYGLRTMELAISGRCQQWALC